MAVEDYLVALDWARKRTTTFDLVFVLLDRPNEEMDRLGGEEQGYERVRGPTSDPSDFNVGFQLHTEEHREWLEAAGTI